MVEWSHIVVRKSYSTLKDSARVKSGSINSSQIWFQELCGPVHLTNNSNDTFVIQMICLSSGISGMVIAFDHKWSSTFSLRFWSDMWTDWLPVHTIMSVLLCPSCTSPVIPVWDDNHLTSLSTSWVTLLHTLMHQFLKKFCKHQSNSSGNAFLHLLAAQSTIGNLLIPQRLWGLLQKHHLSVDFISSHLDPQGLATKDQPHPHLAN